VDLSALSSSLETPAGTRLRIIGNLPYSVATAVVRKLLEAGHLVSDAVLTVQSEVAARLLAGPGGHDYGYISVLVALHCRASRLFDIGPAAFVPQPKVRSTVLALDFTPGQPLSAAARRALEKILGAAFGQRRKTLANALRELPAREGPTRRDGMTCLGREPVTRSLARCGLSVQSRPEDVPPSDWVAIASFLQDILA
jgi:16S rRNA (adenine1518-N6/adenine1519-N6)-dimethyltransferase